MATLVANIKSDAKQRARTRQITYGAALNEAAQDAGFPSWHALHQAHLSYAGAAATPAGAMPLDRILPPNFDDTRSDARSTPELDAWWDRPYAVTCPELAADLGSLVISESAQAAGTGENAESHADSPPSPRGAVLRCSARRPDRERDRYRHGIRQAPPRPVRCLPTPRQD